MRRLGSVLGALVLVVAASLAADVRPAGAAVADPWRPAIDLGPAASANPRVVTDDLGREIAVVHARDGVGGTRDVVVQRVGASGLEAVHPAFKGVQALGGVPRPAVGRDGTVWVTQQVQLGGEWRQRVVGVRRDGRRIGAWATPTGVLASIDGRVFVGASGVPTLVWLVREGGEGRGFRSARWVGGRWTPPATVTTHPVVSGSWDATADGTGRVTVAWTAGPTGGSLRVRTMSSGGEWGSTGTIASPETTSADQVSVGANARGDLALAWRATDPGAARRVRTAYRAAAGGGWKVAAAPVSEALVLDQASYQPTAGAPFSIDTRLRVAVGPSGDALVVWVREDGGQPVLEAAQHVEGAAWGFPARVSLPGHRAYEPAVAIGWDETAVVTWTDSTGTGGRIHALRLEPHGIARTTLSAGQDDYWSVVGMTADGDTLVVWNRDAGGVVVAQLRAHDGSGPTSTLAVPAGPVARRASVPVRWSARDRWGLVEEQAVQVRSATHRGDFGAWSAFATSPATSKVLAGRAGRTYCLRARARDDAANAGAWTSRCVVLPVDDRAAARRGTWRRTTSAGAWQRTVSVATKRGASLRVGGVRARQVSLVFTRCPSCGVVEVRHAGRLLGRFSLRGATATQVVRRVLTSSTARTGTLVVTVVSAGKPVILDGFAVHR